MAAQIERRVSGGGVAAVRKIIGLVATRSGARLGVALERRIVAPPR